MYGALSTGVCFSCSMSNLLYLDFMFARTYILASLFALDSAFVPIL